MSRVLRKIGWFDETGVNRATSITISVGMAASFVTLFVFHQKPIASVVLLIAIAISALPLLTGTVREVLRLNFSVVYSNSENSLMPAI